MRQKSIIFYTFFVFLAIALTLVSARSSKAIDANDDDITIASFNIQVFGTTKISHPKVKKFLVKTLQRFSVIFVQEIRDASQTAIFELLDSLNADVESNYKMVLSSREGRTVSKEQYAYIFRPDHVQLIDVLEYEDKDDWFERPPYGMKMKTKFGQKIMLLGAHLSPSDAVAEIDHLADVYHEIHHDPWIGSSDQFIFMGDFNAGCRYVSESKWPDIRLRNETDTFHWLIKDDQVTTTVGGGDCAYDRFVVGNGIVPITESQASVFNYTTEFSLDEEMSRKISDHYPIFMKIHDTNRISSFKRRKQSEELFIRPPPAA